MQGIVHMKKWMEPKVVEIRETLETPVIPHEVEESTAQPVSADPAKQDQLDVQSSVPQPSSPSPNVRPLCGRLDASLYERLHFKRILNLRYKIKLISMLSCHN